MKPLIPKFLIAATSPELFPAEGPPEIAFLGRSNVGKSSLINSLLGTKVAHVSSTPGRTRSINFIGLYEKPTHPQPRLMLVDLPGYGYAKISRSISAEWPKFIDPYLRERPTLRLCVALVDSNVPPQESDGQLLDFLRAAGRQVLVVATKTDRLSGNERQKALAALRREHGLAAILPYSVKTGAGRKELWQAIQDVSGAASEDSHRPPR